MRENQVALCPTTSTMATLYWFCLQVFRQARQQQRVDWLASIRNIRKVSFTKTQRRIASSRIEPRAGNLSIMKPTLFYQLSYCRRRKKTKSNQEHPCVTDCFSPVVPQI